MTFFVNDNIGLIWILNQSSVENGGASRERSVAVGISGRWKVACDM